MFRIGIGAEAGGITTDSLLEKMKKKYQIEIFYEDYDADLNFMPNPTREYKLSNPTGYDYAYIFSKGSCTAIGFAGEPYPYKPYDWYIFLNNTTLGWKCAADIIGKIMVAHIHTNNLFTFTR